MKNVHSLHADFTFHRRRETNRIFISLGTDRGSKAWHYVLLVDDPETICIFKEKTQGKLGGTLTVDVTDYGVVLKSGFGEEPPQEAEDWLTRVLKGIEILVVFQFPSELSLTNLLLISNSIHAHYIQLLYL